MTRRGIDSSWIRNIDEKLTFCGALEEYYEDCSKNWKLDKTKDSYDSYYNNVILPNLRDHNHKSIDEYTREDFDETILLIAQKGQSRSTCKYIPYADSTLQKFRHLIDVVVVAAANHGQCENVLWGSCFTIKDDESVNDAIKERVQLRKSLSIQEERAIADFLLTDPKQRGQEMGLLLMFALGLRNNEACAANYGDIRPMRQHPDCKVLWIYKSTIVGTNELKTSGKTRNADRIIPIPDSLVKFIEERIHYLEQHLILDKNADVSSIADLPIACVGDDHFSRCSAGLLTSAGREMFRHIKMSSKKLAFIDSELTDKDVASELNERDPSAYLLRRNFGTHLSILGLTQSEIEYVIGHDIQDAYETRNEFVNDARLWEIKQKLDQRPILNSAYLNTTKQDVALGLGTKTICGNTPYSGALRMGHGTALVRINATEPLDELRIKISSDSNEITGRLLPYSTPHRNKRTIDILKKYHELYQNE